MTLSLHMKADGTDAFPSQETIAERARVSRRSVVAHLGAAERCGWLLRREAGRNGQGWRLTVYEAVVPDSVYQMLPERPWEADPTWKRGD